MTNTLQNPRLKVLFVHSYPPNQVASFVNQDLNLLQQLYPVKELSLKSVAMPKGPLVSPAVWRAVAQSDLVFVWFSSLIGIVAKMLRKPCLLVAGGADVVSVPAIHYGIGEATKRRRSLILLGIKLTSKVLLFSESSRQSLLSIPGIKADNLQTVYLSIDGDHFKPDGRKKPQTLTIGNINESNLRRKGLLTFAQASPITPEFSYRMGGRLLEPPALETINAAASANFTYLGYLDDTQLLAEYQQARVYAQLSMHEGFGMALAEAMACECIPVVTDQGSIPEVVGDTGLYVPIEDPAAAGNAIRQIINDPTVNKLGQQARQRIIDLFPPAKRKAELQTIIETLVTK